MLLSNSTLFFSSLFLLREEDKNIFDYCRENNIDHVTNAIRSKKVDVNMKDEKVLSQGRDYSVLKADMSN